MHILTDHRCFWITLKPLYISEEEMNNCGREPQGLWIPSALPASRCFPPPTGRGQCRHPHFKHDRQQNWGLARPRASVLSNFTSEVKLGEWHRAQLWGQTSVRVSPPPQIHSSTVNCLQKPGRLSTASRDQGGSPDSQGQASPTAN